MTRAQLRNFTDACQGGYGTVSYIRMKNSLNHIHVIILLGKGRGTPLKAITIPGLELSAAVLAAKVDAMVKAELRIQLQESAFWTNSTSVLKSL